jgi:hypothetical protein
MVGRSNAVTLDLVGTALQIIGTTRAMTVKMIGRHETNILDSLLLVAGDHAPVHR